MQLADKTLALCFSQGVSLEEWRRKGLFDREVQIYNRVAPELASVQFHTFGSSDEVDDREGLHPTITVHPNRLPLLKKASRRWANPLPAFRASALKRIDIIKTNQVSAAPLAIWAKRRFGTKLITRCGYLWSDMARQAGTDSRELNRILLRERPAFQAADLCVVPTSDIRDLVVEHHGIAENKVRILPNYVDTDIFKPDSLVRRQPGMIAFVGRLEPQKNLAALIRAIAKANTHLRDHGKPDHYRLLLVGEGSERQALQTLGDSLSVSLTFSDRVANHELPKLLNQAEAFALVSHYEGYPKTSIEAMACGLPVIGSDISGTRDQVIHGKSGLLCATDADSIAGAILEVMADRKMRDELGTAAREQIVQTVSLDATVSKELDIYREVLAG